MIESVFTKELFIIGYVEKFHFIIRVLHSGMVKNVGRLFYRCFRYGGGDQFTINLFADIRKQIPVIYFSRISQVLTYLTHLYRIEIADIVCGIGSHGGVHRYTFVGRPLYLLALFFDDAQSHTVDEHHIIARQFVQVIGRDLP